MYAAAVLYCMCLNWFFGLLLWIKHILQFFEEANVYKHSSTDAQNGAEKLELYNEKKKKKNHGKEIEVSRK